MEDTEKKYREQIRRLNISLFNPPVRSPSKAQLIIVRHAFSEINLKMLEFLTVNHAIVKDNKLHPGRRQLLLGKEEIDSPLHEIGILQCKNNQQHINLIDFSIVLVSPLRRTLQTTIHLFMNHPNRSNIKFIVFPICSEKLSTTSSFSPHTLTTSRAEIEELASKYDITFDYSYFNQFEEKERWQIEMLCHDHFHMKQRMQEKASCALTYRDFVLGEFNDHFPEYLETWEQLYERTQTAKDQIKQILASTDKKVALISHGYFIKCLTAEGITQENEIIKGIDIKNCQIVPYPQITK